jgi:broad-specificity NMP kinase
MSISILVTAVSGTGKSTVCKALQELGCNSHDIESIEGLYGLVDEKTGHTIPGNLDQIREGIDWNCNKTKLEALLGSAVNEPTFYCGGMSNTEEVWDLFDSVIILTVSDETTVQRLSKRSSGKFGSTKENRDWVLSWKYEMEKRWLRMGGVMVSAEHSPKKIAENIMELTHVKTP